MLPLDSACVHYPSLLELSCLRLLLLVAAFTAAGCGASDDSTNSAGTMSSRGGESPGTSSERQAILRDATASAGIDFQHENGATGAFYYPELMQGGAALLDYDGDGDLDLYAVQSGPLPARAQDGGHQNVLFRNLGGLRFERVVDSGSEDLRYGSGAAAADYDGDGDTDLYVTNLGRNTLLRNRGNGSFEDVTEQFRVGDPSYSTSAVWFDMEGDGDLDLYVANYVAWSPEAETRCLGYNGLEGYCGPHEYEPQFDTLYRNDTTHFTDVSASAGIRKERATGLGVVAADFDRDGDDDLYVANDQRANFLWTNDGTGNFENEALLLGAALNEQGLPEAGMGVVAEDFDLDGDLDLFMTHLSGETNTFYRNEGTSFRDATDDVGLGAISQPYTGFGVVYADLDLDGRRDLFLANGKVSPGDTVEFDYAEPNQLLLGQPGNGFAAAAEEALEVLEVSRATPAGDLDGDGDVDFFVVNNQGQLRLFENTASPANASWLTVSLQADPSRPLAAVTAETAGGLVQLTAYDAQSNGTSQLLGSDLYQSGYGYATSNDPRAHLTLEESREATAIDLTVDLPGGRRLVILDVPTNRELRISATRRSKGSTTP